MTVGREVIENLSYASRPTTSVNGGIIDIIKEDLNISYETTF